MKKLYSCFLFLILLSSCNEDRDALHRNSGSNVNNAPMTNRAGDLFPFNSDNPYDNAGRLHTEISMTYYSGTYYPTTLLGISTRVSALANSIPEFTKLKSIDSRD